MNRGRRILIQEDVLMHGFRRRFRQKLEESPEEELVAARAIVDRQRGRVRGLMEASRELADRLEAMVAPLDEVAGRLHTDQVSDIDEVFEAVDASLADDARVHHLCGLVHHLSRYYADDYTPPAAG